MPSGPWGLPEALAGVMMLALTAYALTGGADFGGGVWDLLASGPRRDAQREQIARSIGPIWEANHVWLIVVVVMFFTAFPAAFAMLGVVLHIPIALALVGIVMRGSAFVFRRYGSGGALARVGWGRVFAIASVITPLFLGDVVGAISTGAVGGAYAEIGRVSFVASFVMPWFAPFPVLVGVLALVQFAFLAAVYLALDAADEHVREDFRQRALGAALALFAAALAALALAPISAPRLAWGLMVSPWALVLHGATAVAALSAIGALWTRRFRLARVAAAAQVSLMLWGWAVAEYPLLVPPSLTIRGAAAPRVTLSLLAWGLAGGAAILGPSLRYLFRVFEPGKESTQARPGR